MRKIRWIVLVWLLLVTIAFAGWELSALLSRDPEKALDATDQPDSEREAKADIYGVVKSFDAAHNRITLSVEPKDDEAQEQTFDIADDVQVLLDGGPAALAGLTADTRVALELRAAEKLVTAIRSEPFRITVKTKQEEFQVGKPFEVELGVVNVSPAPQSFWVWSNCWEMHWGSSNRNISAISSGCYGNFPIAVRLAPGEAYAKPLRIRAMVSGQLQFKMSFTPLTGEWPPASSKRTYWSSGSMLQVTEGRES